jgi:DNA-binding LytR/AlgR family response regulator
MIKTIVIEDERIIAEELKRMILAASVEIELVATLSTVKESVDYLSTHESPDLIFSDVQLPDGLSFEIFTQLNVTSPVVFVTAYDEFIVNAFEHNAIEYLLKPVDSKDLQKALRKYKDLEKHFNYHSFVNTVRQRTRSRLIVKKGIESIALKTENIAIVYTEDKLVFVLDNDGEKYRVDKNLAELEQELDPAIFFRANRQYIVNIGCIKSYKTFEKVKLQIDLMSDLNHHIVISQETASEFRKWMSEG